MSRPVHVRHVVDGLSTDAGAIAVLGRYFAPQDRSGVNGPAGYMSGTNNRKLREEADFTIAFPNTTGGDGIRHLDRFLILALRAVTGRDYKPGDEWIEVYEGDEPTGDLIACGTPIDYTITKTTIELQCKDALKTLAHVRETAGGLYWCAAPRDVFEHYTQVWDMWLADDFPQDGRFTYSAADQTTADGRYQYRNVRHAATAYGSQIELAPVGLGGAYFTSLLSVPIGPTSSEPRSHYRWEVVVVTTGMVGDDSFQLYIQGGPTQITFYGDGRITVTGATAIPSSQFIPNARHSLAIEYRDRWTYCYADGRLVAVVQAGLGVGAAGQPWVSAGYGINGSGGAARFRVESLTARRTRPYLLRGSDKGDYRLAGAPPPGGLLGSYFSEVATNQAWGPGLGLLSPALKPYARRLDPTINFAQPAALPNTWQPTGTPNGEKFSARWTGAIYLDDPSTWLIRATASDRVRVWVGKTRWGEQIIDFWGNDQVAMTTTTAAATLSALGTKPGWYPIIVEYSEETTTGGIILEAQKSGGAWVVPGSTTAGAPQLSPLGIFEDQVRAESHATMVKQIADTFGFQYLCEPMPLESNEFPGRVAPRLRVGTDYDLTTTEDADTSLQAQGSAEDCVDVLMADGQGLADQAGAAQLTAEVINYDQVGRHLLIHSEAENGSDISVPELLLQRLNALLALRSAPFEQVSAVIETEGGERALVPVPLTGVPTEIAWLPGDGIKRCYTSLGVEDVSPVQLTTVSRPFRPAAHGLPAVTYRPRPRDFRDFLLRLQRDVVAPQRNYQGQLGPVLGNMARVTAAADIPDTSSRVGLPASIDQVKAATLIVHQKDDTSVMNVSVNGTNKVTVDRAGRYDLSPYIARDGTNQRMYAGMNGGTGNASFQLELLELV